MDMPTGLRSVNHEKILDLCPNLWLLSISFRKWGRHNSFGYYIAPIQGNTSVDCRPAVHPLRSLHLDCLSNAPQDLMVVLPRLRNLRELVIVADPPLLGMSDEEVALDREAVREFWKKVSEHRVLLDTIHFQHNTEEENDIPMDLFPFVISLGIEDRRTADESMLSRLAFQRVGNRLTSLELHCWSLINVPKESDPARDT